MKLHEFIKDITKEMEENKWQDKEVEFCTIDSSDLLYLSIYGSDDNKVCIDVGTEEDNEKHSSDIASATKGIDWNEWN